MAAILTVVMAHISRQCFRCTMYTESIYVPRMLRPVIVCSWSPFKSLQNHTTMLTILADLFTCIHSVAHGSRCALTRLTSNKQQHTILTRKQTQNKQKKEKCPITKAEWTAAVFTHHTTVRRRLVFLNFPAWNISLMFARCDTLACGTKEAEVVKRKLTKPSGWSWKRHITDLQQIHKNKYIWRQTKSGTLVEEL